MMVIKKILVLEDDINLGFILQEHLEMHGFSVKLCVNGVEGLEEYLKNPYDLLLVDVMMPRKNGFAFVKEVRLKDEKIPVIFLTAKSLKEDRIEGFKIGCDDYVTKPFSMEELLLRIQAVLRRFTRGNEPEADSENSRFIIGPYIFDYDRQLLQFRDKKMQVTSKESELLRLLCLNINKTLPRETALKIIWGDNSYFNARSMDVFISRIRKYFKDDPAVSITNIHGKGYKLSAR
ncbi:MAG: response regulator transcription factor [Ignavibacteria bacterium]|jgi:DNA-binding response OmpR family regulator|nr:response regulator transcription factor [Ignavibacteria bacterium]MCU7517042.1 response regulator transcription factor [Ignavibacteria bacterium]